MSRGNERELLIAVVGPGSLGLLWAAYLQEQHAVCLVSRPGSPSRSQSYRIRTPEGLEWRINVPQYPPEAFRAPPRLILVTTKAQDAEQALAPVIERSDPNTPVVLFQNGLGPQASVARRYPGHPIMAASSTEGANRPSPELLKHAGRGVTWVGGLTPGGYGQAENIAMLLGRTGLHVSPTSDIENRLWRKLAINAGINPYTAVLDCRNGELLGRPIFKRQLPFVCQEFAKVAAANGHDFSAEVLEEEIRDVAARTAYNISSMLQDVRAGKPTEIESINGFIVAEGERLGMPTPFNRWLLEEVRALQRTTSTETG